ncbi:hypothetical protein L518_0319 [Bordetella bronchiseptica MBORD675]|nr:hypothetical protein L518_0319 [Bordetella bronchiseptica MBORD675]
MTPRRPGRARRRHRPAAAIPRRACRASRRACLPARRRPPARPPCWPAAARVAGKP